MSKWIRWPGLIAFVAVIGLAAALWLLVIDEVIERAIEAAGTKAVGAKVDLASADLHLFPLGLTLTGLQVTDPDEPMTNAVQVDRIAFNLDGLNLLRRKVIIEEMAVEGVRFGTPRTHSGAVAKPAGGGAVSKAVEAAKASLPTFTVPDVNDILSKESLESLTLADTLKADLQAQKDKWQKELAALPNKEKLEGYKKRLEGLKSAGKGGVAGVLGGANEVLAIQKEIAADIDRIKQAQQSLESDLATLHKRMDDVAKAPLEDVKRLKEKYNLSPGGLFKVGSLFLEGPMVEQTRKALYWYEKAQPYLNRPAEKTANVEVVKPLRGKGVDVRFTEREPLPDFLIRTAKVGLVLSVGNIGGQVRNITPDQPILGQPLTFAFKGDKLDGLKAVTLDGAVDRIHSGQPKDTAVLKASGYRVPAMTLSESKDLPIALKGATADLAAQVTLKGQELAGSAEASIGSIALASGGGDNLIAKAVAGALADVKATTLKADVAGTIEHYEVRVTTDLDRVLSDAVSRQLTAQLANFDGQLKAAIAAKVSPSLDGLKGQFGDLTGIDKDLTARLQEATGLGKGGKGQSILPSVPSIPGLGDGGLKLPF